MAPNPIHTLFKASEEVSGELTKASRSVSGYDRNLADLNVTLAMTEARTEGGEEAFDDMANSSRVLRSAMGSLDTHLDKVRRSFLVLQAAEEPTEEQMDNFRQSVSNANIAANALGDGMDGLRNSYLQVDRATNMTEEQTERLGDSVSQVYRNVQTLQSGLAPLNAALFGTALTAEGLDDEMDDVADEINDVSRAAVGATSSLGLLAAVNQSTALSFGNLSVNIGPFNVGLRNLLFQLPAILVGMGSLLAMVVALTTAIVTLTGTLAALFAGGAVAFFEEHSDQFEDTAEAMEAMTGALRDLFINAIRPLATRANLELFIGAINMAARVVNRFAQFFSQMREDVLGFFDGVGGDMEAFFESLHDSLEIVEPVLQDLINFFVERFPAALIMFSNLTVEMSNALGPLIQSFRRLFNTLAEFLPVFLDGVVPVLVMVINIINSLVTIINMLPDSVITVLAAFIGLMLIGLRLISMSMGLFNAMAGLTAVMTQQAVAGGALGQIYLVLRGNVLRLIAGEITLAQALAATRAAFVSNAIAALSSAQAFITKRLASTALTGALVRQIGIVKALIAGNIGLSGALKLTAASVWSATTSFIGLNVATGGLLIALGLLAAVLLGVGEGSNDAAEGFHPLIDTLQVIQIMIEGIIAGIQDLADLVGGGIFGALGMDTEGFEGGRLKAMMEGETADGGAQDDIQTQKPPELNFQEELQQNIDVDADPEDTDTMKRAVKDAMDEANALRRRREGGAPG